MSSIPLPALHAAVPQTPDVGEQYSRALALKSMMQNQQLQQQQMQTNQQQQQIQQLAIQQHQRQLKDSEVLSKAFLDWDPQKDPNGDSLVQNFVKGGGSGQGALEAQQQILARRKEYSQIAKDDAETGQKKLQTLKESHDMMAGRISQILASDDASLPQNIIQGAQQAVQDGLLDPQHAQQAAQIAQLGDPKAMRQQLEIFKKGYQGETAQIDAAMKSAELPGKQAESQMKVQDAALSPMERALKGQNALEYYAAKGDPMAQAALQKKIEVAKASRPITNTNLLAGGGANANDALDMAAEFYRQTGQLPAGFGRSPQTTAAVIKRAAELAKGMGPGAGDIAANKAQYKSFQAMDTDFKKGKAANNIRSLNTSIGHLGMLYDAVDALDNGNVKMLNQIANTFNVDVRGKSAPAIFDAIKTAATGELGSTFKGAAATDPEIASIAATLNRDLSGQINKDVIRTDAQLLGSRLYALHEQYKQGNNGKPAAFRILYPHSENTLKRMQVKMDEFKEATSDGNPQQGNGAGPLTVKLPSGKVVEIN